MSTGITQLDEIVDLFHQRQVIDGHQKNPVVEITSPASGDGKTSLLYYITALATLPVQYGGKGGAVIYIDADHRFSAARLRDVALSYLRKRRTDDLFVDESNLDLDVVVEESLLHVHVFRPKSSQSLLATVQSLEGYLLDTARHKSGEREVRGVVLDSASAFYWQDRREAEILSIPGALEEIRKKAAAAAAGGGDARILPRPVMGIAQDTVKTLRKLQDTFYCPVYYTVCGHHRVQRQNRGGMSMMSFKPFLPRPWPGFPTLRLVVRRDPVRPFVPYISPDQAQEEAGHRQEVVERGKFSGWIDPFGKEEWPAHIIESTDSLDGKGGFSFTVTEEGVDFHS